MSPTQEGTTLGSYRIVSQVGQGGMATVYKAYQTSMERLVALKVLSPQHTQDPDFTQRFIREARTIAQLEHRNILPVYDFGENDGVVYMSMRYLEGGTLRDILKQGTPSLHESIDIIQQICSGLDYAHREGIVHRDIKPANVMIDSEGTVYLADFGLAKSFEKNENLTASGIIMGTPHYMAPEQSMGSEIDGRADIYATGVILYEMLTGSVPFDAKTPLSIIMAHVHEPLPRPRMLDPKIPIEIEDIIVKALEKNPDDRFQTAKEMADALSQAKDTLTLQRDTATLALLADKARAESNQKSLQPTEIGFTALPQASRITTAEPDHLSTKAVLLRVGIVAVLLALGIFIGVKFLGNDQGQGLEKKAGMALYDNFNETRSDNFVDTSRWDPLMEENCHITQEGGVVIVTNTLSDVEIADCDLLVSQPRQISLAGLEGMEAKIYVSSDFNGETAGQGIMYSTSYPNDDNLFIICGAEDTEDGLVGQLWVARETETASVEKYFASVDIDPNAWNTYKMHLDPQSGEVSCFVNTQLAGRYTIEDFSTLKNELFERGLTAWRGANSFATTKVDDFKLTP